MVHWLFNSLGIYEMSNLKMIVWVNLFIGLYNLWLYSMEWNLFNLIIGSLNIGVWVFYRRVD